MATDQQFADYVVEQLRGVPRVRTHKMFGEYALYLGDKVVALICDNQLFVKPTAAGRAVIGTLREAPPFPGAKPFYLIEGELDDPGVLARIILATDGELPAPKPKKAKPAKGPKGKSVDEPTRAAKPRATKKPTPKK